MMSSSSLAEHTASALAATRMPTYFIPHGGGPWPFVPQMAHGHAELARFLRTFLEEIGKAPRAFLVASAHWEAPVVTVSARGDYSMLYDYGGFPPETYRLQYPAPGSPEVAARVVELLHAAGLPSATEHDRGYDHGVFVPLMVAAPEATIPVVPISLVDGLDPALHLAIGRALAPLRDEGVVIIGSGMSMHNIGALLSGAGAPQAARFDAWLAAAVTSSTVEREARLLTWESAPEARFSHPEEEHLLPLMVAAGAADGDAAQRVFSGEVLGTPVSAFRFG